jgi:glutamine cyclotransferase
MFTDMMNMRIAVDFDGTIVEHKYPEIGEVKLFAFETLKELQKKGFRLILWTFRTGRELEEAVAFCRRNGVEFYAVNKNYPEEVFDEEMVSRKIDADVYIDDKNLQGFPGWSKVWEILVPDEMERRNEMIMKKGRRKLLGGLFGKKRSGFILDMLFALLLAGVTLPAGGCRDRGVAAGKADSVVTAPEKSEEGLFSRTKKKIVFLRPKGVLTFQAGKPVPYELTAGDSADVPDSVVMYVDDRRLERYSGGYVQGVWDTRGVAVGIHALRAVSFQDGKKQRSKAIHIVLTSDYVPKKMTYEVVNVYPHDRKAYTQGLVYEDGYIYEGTGLRGSSTLRKWELESGKVVESRNLPPDLFGEGICILGDKIYQLTWTSRIGFVYDKASFTLIRKLKYSTQGWGLTTDGEHLIMSDGSNNLYVLDPKYFSVIRRISVYDDRGPVNQLNELEYIDGTIYANVYQTDDIVRIDPSCGKVLARINLRGILPRKEYHSDTDVLNGIAWDAQGKRIFVTGKNWPKLFEVRFVPVH